MTYKVTCTVCDFSDTVEDVDEFLEVEEEHHTQFSPAHHMEFELQE